MTPDSIKIKLGESGTQFLQKNNLPSKGHINKQPAGVSFYEQDWNTKSPGTVIVEHDRYSFQIPYALGVMGAEDTDYIELGLAKFYVNAGITATDTILHDEARKEFITVLQKLLQLGWKPVISYNYPRLAGAQAFQYYEEDNAYGVPANYNPSLEEWMRIDSDDWSLYADGIFLEIHFRRDRKLMNPTEPGAYLFSFNLSSKEEFAKSYFQGEEERKHWRDLWVDKIKSLKKERYAKEKELLKRGFTLYSEYEEPKIHPADPVEP